MFKPLLLIALGLGSIAAAPPPVEVMVVGAYHFGNPGRDINNVKVESVLTPTRQAELARVANALASFKPTHVMVEMESDAPNFAVGEYQKYSQAMLDRDANEIVQIGYRTARVAGVKTVNGIDEQPKPGEPDYFPFDKVTASAAKFGQAAQLAAMNTPIAAFIKKFEADQKTQSVAQLLVQMNDPSGVQGTMDGYYGLLPLGDKDDQAGADLNAMWYLRNAKIFGKLMQVAKPGDRVLVIYGAGHGFWLRHFASNAPGYRNVDVMPYLKQAEK